MGKKIPRSNETPTSTEPAPAAPPEGFTVGSKTPPAAFLRRQGIGLRDVAMVERYASALAGARDALYRGDSEGIRVAYQDLTRLSRDAESIRNTLRKGISRREA